MQEDKTICFFCYEPLTSDDFKLDRIEEVKDYIAHRKCVDKVLQEYWLK